MSTTAEDIGTHGNLLERARKNGRILGKRVEQAGLVPISAFCGMSKSWVHALLSENRDAVAKALAYVGLKLVPVEMRCFDPAEIEMLRWAANKYWASLKSADDLDWDEEHE